MAAAIAQHTENVRPIIALRPNTMYPTVAAKALATLDQLSDGRATSTSSPAATPASRPARATGCAKSERYARSAEFIRILRQTWASSEPFDFAGEYYSFEDFRAEYRPVRGSIPVSVGGSSAEAYRVGGALADIFGLWGEPLAETREQIDAVHHEAARSGRPDRPRIWVTFRPIIAPTEELAWEKAYRVLSALQLPEAARFQGSPPVQRSAGERRLATPVGHRRPG